jgi:cation:H+ antiporter
MNAMILPILLLIAGCVLMFFGGDWFVGAAAGIARRLGLPRFVIGATVVSLGTTLPEILTSCLAASQGKTDMAIGNAVGSASVNVGLVLGLGVVFMPVAIPRRQIAWKGLLLFAAVGLAWFFSWTGRLFTAVESIGLLALCALFIFENAVELRREQRATQAKRDDETLSPVWKDAARFAAGLSGILLGAWLFVSQGSALARLAGVSEGVIALTIIAFGTSLPELVTLLAALRKREMSLSAGNILGASFIDTALILPLCAWFSPAHVNAPRQLIRLDFPVCLVLVSLAVLPALLHKRFTRWQGALLLVCYIGYVCVLFVS